MRIHIFNTTSSFYVEKLTDELCPILINLLNIAIRTQLPHCMKAGTRLKTKLRKVTLHGLDSSNHGVPFSHIPSTRKSGRVLLLHYII